MANSWVRDTATMSSTEERNGNTGWSICLVETVYFKRFDESYPRTYCVSIPSDAMRVVGPSRPGHLSTGRGWPSIKDSVLEGWPKLTLNCFPSVSIAVIAVPKGIGLSMAKVPE